jgi:tripeptide aminopeptidase
MLARRFIKYTMFDTQSDENSQTTPSTAKQWIFARFLRDEMISEGLHDVVLDDKGYLYATLPANTDAKDLPTIGFIAHYDTSPDCSGAGIRTYITHDDTTGEDIIRANAPGNSQESAAPTLLGADDKAGIAEIMQAMCYLRDNPDIPHGTIRVAFNPDEEIGLGARNFDVERFGCDFAYTIDGGDLGELEYENFNAASAKIYIKGLSIHPGYAKGKMVNAARIATEFAAMMPADQTPETTEGYEGFWHLTGMEGSCGEARLSYIIRDHDREKFEERKVFIQGVADKINQKYGEGTCQCVVADQYYNMLEKLAPHMHIIERAKRAMLDAGVTPRVQPIRGGTDGAQLSFMGLPCPNIFTGAIDFHGPNEHVSIQTMQKAMMTIVNIARGER